MSTTNMGAAKNACTQVSSETQMLHKYDVNIVINGQSSLKVHTLAVWLSRLVAPQVHQATPQPHKLQEASPRMLPNPLHPPASDRRSAHCPFLTLPLQQPSAIALPHSSNCPTCSMFCIRRGNVPSHAVSCGSISIWLHFKHSTAFSALPAVCCLISIAWLFQEHT